MARLRLTIGGAIPVDPIRPPLVMGGGFTVAATASLTSGLGRAALAIGGSLTAYAAQALSGAFTVSAGARLKADLSGAFVVAGTAGTVAAVGDYALSPAYGTKWAKHQDAVSDASITQLGAGLGARLLGGTAVADNTNGVALWGKRRTTGDWDATFTTKKLDATSPASSALADEFLLFCFGMTGNGGATFPADVSTWAATTNPYSHTYRDNCTGARLTLYDQTDAAPTVAHTAALGVFNGDGTVTNVAGTTAFPFVQNTTYTWTISRRGNTIAASATDGVSTWSDTWTSALLTSKADAGNVGLLVSPSRQIEVGDVTLTDAVVSTAWPNGYLYRRRLVLAAQGDLAPETVADFPYFIDSTEVPGDWSFLVTANGKLLTVTGGVPYDIRFTDEAGVKLDHDIEAFDGTAGTLRAFVRVPSWACATADFRMLMYYGKAGDTDQRNIPGVWQGASLVVDPTTGTDLTGKNRTFTRTGSITNTTLDGRPAIQVADQTGGFLRRTNSDLSVFDGLADLSEEFWAKVSTASSGNGARLGGAVGDAFPKARFSWWAEATGTTSGTAANVLQAGANWWGSDLKYHNESTESIAGIADGSTVRHLMFVYQSNQHTKLYDGETDISSANFLNAPSVGTIHPQSTDNYSIGAGTGAQTTSPALTMGLYSLWPFAFSATRRALSDRCQRDGSLVASLGGVDLVGDTNHGPAGVTFRQAITAQTSIAFQGHAYDPDAGAAIVATAVTPASDSTATYAIVGGQLSVTPIAGATGVGRPVVTISDGAKTSKVSPVLAISSVVAPPSGAPFFIPNLSGLTAAVINTDADLTSFINTANYAQFYADVPTVKVLGRRTISRGGTQAHPMYIVARRRTAGDHTDFASRAQIGALTMAAPFVWLDGFVHTPSGSGACVTVNTTDTSYTRGWFQPGTGAHGLTTSVASLRTRVGLNLFDSDGRSGDFGDIDQSFSKTTATNPDYWDCYLNDHFPTTTNAGALNGGMALYAEPGIPFPAAAPGDIGQPHSFWRRCRVRTTTKFGVYAKHNPHLVECDGAYADRAGAIGGGAHVFGYRGNSSQGGKFLRLRAQCVPGAIDADGGQTITVQSWNHEVGWCIATDESGGDGLIKLFCRCEKAGDKPLQAASFADVHHCKGKIVLGAIRPNWGAPTDPIRSTVISAHDGPIVDNSGNAVRFNGTTGAITSTHTWIQTTGATACKIFTSDPQGRAGKPYVTLTRAEVGPGSTHAKIAVWDGVGAWPTTATALTG